MTSLVIPIHHHYGLLLATFKEENGERVLNQHGQPILNHVRDYNLDEVPENSIGILK